MPGRYTTDARKFSPWWRPGARNDMDLPENPARWTRAQAQAFFDWLMQQLLPRAHAVQQRFPGNLLQVGQAAIRTLSGPDYCFYEERQLPPRNPRDPYESPPEFVCWHLTAAGVELARDLGLLVAVRLQEALPHLRWRIGRPNEGALHNLPVLGSHFEPWFMHGPGIALEELRGRREGRLWQETFDRFCRLHSVT